jgi:hypothetical protein
MVPGCVSKVPSKFINKQTFDSQPDSGNRLKRDAGHLCF